MSAYPALSSHLAVLIMQTLRGNDARILQPRPLHVCEIGFMGAGAVPLVTSSLNFIGIVKDGIFSDKSGKVLLIDKNNIYTKALDDTVIIVENGIIDEDGMHIQESSRFIDNVSISL